MFDGQSLNNDNLFGSDDDDFEVDFYRAIPDDNDFSDDIYREIIQDINMTNDKANDETTDINNSSNVQQPSRFGVIEYLDPEYLKEHIDIDFLRYHFNVGRSNGQTMARRYNYANSSVCQMCK